MVFLNKQFKLPDEEKRMKLFYVLYFRKGTQNLPLKLEAKIGLNLGPWWLDAYFLVHSDFKIHTCGVISVDKGGGMELYIIRYGCSG